MRPSFSSNGFNVGMLLILWKLCYDCMSNVTPRKAGVYVRDAYEDFFFFVLVIARWNPSNLYLYVVEYIHWSKWEATLSFNVELVAANATASFATTITTAIANSTTTATTITAAFASFSLSRPDLPSPPPPLLPPFPTPCILVVQNLAIWPMTWQTWQSLNSWDLVAYRWDNLPCCPENWDVLPWEVEPRLERLLAAYRIEEVESHLSRLQFQHPTFLILC